MINPPKKLVLASLLVASFLFNPIQVQGQVDATDWPLGSFHFDFDRLGNSKADQIGALQQLGYQGMALKLANQAQLKQFDEYLDVIQGSSLQVYAAYVPVTLKADNSKNFSHLKKVLTRLVKVDASLWVIVKDDGLDRTEIVNALDQMAEMAAGAGVECVIYPHDRTTIESAEVAMEYIEEMGRDDVFISLHLCHEIRAGNGERLNEVAARIKPWLRLPSISGTDKEFEDAGKGDWSRNIKPLNEGDYDASKLLVALKSVDYAGPILLHTFGLQKAPKTHHADSIATYREMLKHLN